MPTEISKDAEIQQRLVDLYGAERGTTCAERVRQLRDQYRGIIPRGKAAWDQRDVVLITYADQVQHDNAPALPALGRFLDEAVLDELINTVHLLPFYPSSSDDGFSVIDYRAVAKVVGRWQDVQALARQVNLMFDLVLNHVSCGSQWFQRYLEGSSPYDRFFIEVDPQTDLSQVTRPRSSPLLTPVQTVRGERHVWTTFSADQIDLNFADPAVLLEMLDVLLFYAAQGAWIIRLDAIAYLWKTIGTSCIHLPQTHQVVKLIRSVVEDVAPHVLLLTETNVPHAENISYFGAGDEAHMVYQFSLPPLLLDALVNEDASYLMRWLAALEPPPAGNTFFNFTASHDGIGVRPLEGLVPAERIEQLAAATRARQGHVGTRSDAEGNDQPYELNITYLDALRDDEAAFSPAHIQRFLTSQAVMLALQGIPGIYFHSLVGTPNDVAAVRESGIPRRINRRKYQLDTLRSLLETVDHPQRIIFEGYCRLLRIRRAQPAFHPAAEQQAIVLGDPALIAFLRISRDVPQRIVVIANVSRSPRSIQMPATLGAPRRDLLQQAAISADKVQLGAWQTAWLELDP